MICRVLAQLACELVIVGDLEDFEAMAPGCDLLITHAHGRQASARLNIPLFRMGLPIFDRLGAGHITSVGYRGARDLIFDIGNTFMANAHIARPDTWYPSSTAEAEHGVRAPAASH